MQRLQRLTNRDSDQGFTLVELMVVVLIIAILIAIAIPTFLGARVRAQDRASQSNLRNSLTAAKVYYADSSSNYSFAALDLEAVYTGAKFVNNGNPASDEIGYLVFANQDATPDQAVMFVHQSNSGSWFCIWDEGSGSMAGTYYGAAPAATFASFADCQTGW